MLDIEKKIKSFGKLKKNWNDNGADEFDNETIAKAVRISRMLKGQPEVFPTASNAIQFEIEKENYYYLEVTVYKDHAIIYYESNDNHENNYKLINENDEMEVINKFNALYNKLKNK